MTRQEQSTCDTHGDVMRTVLDMPFGGKPIRGACPECVKVDDAQREKEAADEKQERFDKWVEKTGIGEKFKGCTFDNYDVSPDLSDKAEGNRNYRKQALAKCEEFVGSRSGHPGLILTGSPGVGKNHLVTAILGALRANYNELGMIVKAQKLIRAIRESWRPDSKRPTSAVIKEMASVSVLVIDELGRQAGTASEIQIVSEIIDDRYEAGRPTIICSNLEWPEVKALIGEPSFDRFKGGRIVDMKGESWRGK